MHDVILVLCRNLHHAGLIARTLRCREVLCLPVPFDTRCEQAMSCHPSGIILTEESLEPDALEGLDFELLSCGVPVLALDGAAAILCSHFGGSMSAVCDERTLVEMSFEADPLFDEIDPGERMLKDYAELTLSDPLIPLASASGRVIGFRHDALPLYAVQYPVERNDPDAAQMIYNFACGVCGVKADWNEDAIINEAVETIRQAAPEGRVLCAVSGGVDSAVCAKLASLAVGDRLSCLFIDTGLFRQEEPETVVGTYMDTLGLQVQQVEASEMFLRALSGVASPADKERIATQLMTQMLIRQLGTDPEIRTIVMGTNFNDTLFGFAPPSAEKDKLPEGISSCEPIRGLFKEEVRRVAAALELPARLAERQPFPSSGLALRVMSSINAEKLRILREADACFAEEIRQGGYDRRLWQYYATLVESPDTPDGYAVCLRATQAAQGGAMAARMPFDVLERVTQRIREEIPAVKRVVYDLTPSAHYAELE